MCKTEIEEYKDIIRNFEQALRDCHGSEDILYYEKHIELFKKKIKSLGGEV
jgi:hypothetical protein